MTSTNMLGIVIIGRNEGQRLVDCFDSLTGSEAALVYVDSGSTDGSIAMATARGISVVQLPSGQPFTAGRARNAGFRQLIEQHPKAEYVQFIDGDCRVADGWLEFATEFLNDHPKTAIVCGRRKELNPEHSIYNDMCDIEWNTPVGKADACGGDFMARATTFNDSGGFNDSLIAGEEPELCFRIRNEGWDVFRAAPLMTYHDAAMMHFGQWFQRTSRSGYAYAARGALHINAPGNYCQRENLRIAFWAAAWPAAIIGTATLISPLFWLLLLTYPLQFLRLWRHTRRRNPKASAALYAFFMVLGKWPEFYGQTLYIFRRMNGQKPTLIEYK